MEEIIIKRIRKNKRDLLKLYNLIKKETDTEVAMIDPDTLLKLSIISKINEELTDIIYILLNNKNS